MVSFIRIRPSLPFILSLAVHLTVIIGYLVFLSYSFLQKQEAKLIADGTTISYETIFIPEVTITPVLIPDSIPPTPTKPTITPKQIPPKTSASKSEKTITSPTQPQTTNVAVNASTAPSQHLSNAAIAGIKRDYQSELTGWIKKHQQYPRKARKRRLQGVSIIRFRMDQQGRLISEQLIKSSGSSILDEAAMHALQKSSPFPVPPAKLATTNLQFIVPIEFILH